MSVDKHLAKLSPDARQAVLTVLDEISRPLDIREIDLALAQDGISRSQRRPMIRALTTRFDVIVLHPR